MLVWLQFSDGGRWYPAPGESGQGVVFSFEVLGASVLQVV